MADVVSTHDLTKRSTTQQGLQNHLRFPFQLTTSRRGRHGYLSQWPLSRMFQLTTSRRGRRWHIRQRTDVKRVSTHDLTKRSTHSRMSLLPSQICFNSRPHEEVDDAERAAEKKAICFNSRPHEEVDLFDDTLIGLAIIVSTHDLTKRSTFY